MTYNLKKREYEAIQNNFGITQEVLPLSQNILLLCSLDTSSLICTQIYGMSRYIIKVMSQNEQYFGMKGVAIFYFSFILNKYRIIIQNDKDLSINNTNNVLLNLKNKKYYRNKMASTTASTGGGQDNRRSFVARAKLQQGLKSRNYLKID